jgi:hypothetical protein
MLKHRITYCLKARCSYPQQGKVPLQNLMHGAKMFEMLHRIEEQVAGMIQA